MSMPVGALGGLCPKGSTSSPSRSWPTVDPLSSVVRMNRGVLSIRQSSVVVTGGGRGIGAATARELAARGARVVIGDVDVVAAEKTAAELGGLALPLDVTDTESWSDFLAQAEGEVGPPDVLINNAGIMPIGPFVDESDSTTRRQLDINVLGVLNGCRQVIPGMQRRGRGHLVNVASQAGKMAVAGAVTYHATKYAVVGATHALDDELRDTGIAVTCVLPGIVDTELSAGLPTTPLAPRVQPEEIAVAIRRALEKPRTEVWVPRSGAALTLAVRNTPVSARARLLKALGVQDPMLRADQAARAAYETRAQGRVR